MIRQKIRIGLLLVFLAGCFAMNDTYPVYSDATVVIKPTKSGQREMGDFIVEFTYVEHSEDKSRSTIYSKKVGCFNQDFPCLSEPEEVFTVNIFVKEMEWSGDGSIVALLATDHLLSTNEDIYLYDLAQMRLIKITNTEQTEYGPIWFEDKIYYSTCNLSTCEIVKVDAISLKKSIINTNLEGDYYILSDVSRDEKNLLIGAFDEDNTFQVYMYNLEKMYFSQITNTEYPFNNFDASFSNDGNRIIFSREVFIENSGVEYYPHAVDIIVFQLDTKEETDLTRNDVGQYSMNSKWFPIDGWLAMSSDDRTNQRIYLINIEDESRISLLDQPEGIIVFDWRTNE